MSSSNYHGEVDLLALIADDQGMISYRPAWNVFTGSINGTILLQQVVYRWVKHGRQPFYKFSAPCAQPAYREGDSWQEELGMSRKELENAKKKIAVSTKGELSDAALVSYWRDRYHKTWYALNERLLIEKLGETYPSNQQKNVGIQASLDIVNDGTPMHQTGISTNGQKGQQPMHEKGASTHAPMVQPPMAQTDSGADDRNGHSPMTERGTGTDAQKGRPYSKDNSKEDSRDYYIDNSNRVKAVEKSAEIKNGDVAADAVASSGAPDFSGSLLDWMGFNGRLGKGEFPALDLLLAWGMWVHVEGETLRSRGKNPVGIARAGWRRGDPPGGGWLGLARLWIELPDDGRWALIEAAEDGAEYVTRRQEDMGISSFDLSLFSRLCRATAGCPVPGLLWPEDEVER
ncbi:MAG: hypothetical protein AAF902_11500 [Chloroflexota bacterium]